MTKPASSQIAEYLELESKATSGPWRAIICLGSKRVVCEDDNSDTGVVFDDKHALYKDAEFIASSRNIGVKCARALKEALACLDAMVQIDFNDNIDKNHFIDVHLKYIDSIFNPKDIAKLDGGGE
jgi:hypothetical protein